MYDFIVRNGNANENDILEILNSLLAGREVCAYYQYTTGISCEEYKGEIEDIAHLLEVRLFNPKSEIRAVRTGVGKSFIWREIDDKKFKETLNLAGESFEERTYREMQYLDIDTTKSSGKDYCFIGGGNYTLPIENAEKIELLHYGNYDENGLFMLLDFRIVRILAKGEQ